VASEIRNPGRSLPRAIRAAMTVVLSCYVLVNIAYYILLPWDTLSSNDAVAVVRDFVAVVNNLHHYMFP